MSNNKLIPILNTHKNPRLPKKQKTLTIYALHKTQKQAVWISQFYLENETSKIIHVFKYKPINTKVESQEKLDLHVAF